MTQVLNLRFTNIDIQNARLKTCSTKTRRGMKIQRTTPSTLLHPRGSLMIEMVVCTVLLSVVTAVLAPGLFAVHQQRKLTRYDTHSLVELNNLAALATVQAPNELKLSAWFTERYSTTELSVERAENDTSDPDDVLQAIQLTIVRDTPEGKPNIEHSLTIWLPKDTPSTEEAAE